MAARPATLGALRNSGWRSRSVRDELRANLIAAIERGRPLFPGVHGYESTVVPGMVNALLARHDLLLLGLRGQAKSRLLRSLTGFLDEALPAVDGCEINDDPLAPLCARCQRLAGEHGNELPIRWLGRDERYHEKLATPDVTVADLIGDLDPIKAAGQRRSFADPEVIHFGIVPRTHRGLFAINELPDLPPRIQVALLDILEEKDLQIRGFPIRLPIDVVMLFSANPEDYTHRGNIITPLKDRIGSQIFTHYPRRRDVARAITEQEAWLTRGGAIATAVSDRVADLVERVAAVARESELVDHASGVSARLPIALRELLASNLERRGLLTGERAPAARVCDFWAALPAVVGRLEMVYEGEQQGAESVAKRIVGAALRQLFDELFPSAVRPERTPEGVRSMRRSKDDDAPEPPDPYAAIVAAFADGHEVELADDLPFVEYERRLTTVPGLAEMVDSHQPGAERNERAFLMELVLEGLHQSLRLSRADLDAATRYGSRARFDVS